MENLNTTTQNLNTAQLQDMSNEINFFDGKPQFGKSIRIEIPTAHYVNENEKIYLHVNIPPIEKKYLNTNNKVTQ